MLPVEKGRARQLEDLKNRFDQWSLALKSIFTDAGLVDHTLEWQEGQMPPFRLQGVLATCTGEGDEAGNLPTYRQDAGYLLIFSGTQAKAHLPGHLALGVFCPMSSVQRGKLEKVDVDADFHAGTGAEFYRVNVASGRGFTVYIPRKATQVTEVVTCDVGGDGTGITWNWLWFPGECLFKSVVGEKIFIEIVSGRNIVILNQKVQDAYLAARKRQEEALRAALRREEDPALGIPRRE